MLQVEHVRTTVVQRLEWWTRTHRIVPSVKFTILKMPYDVHYSVSVEGWQLPSHFEVLHETLEAAQRAADDVLLAYMPHDCMRTGCGEWNPPVSSTKNLVTTDGGFH
jgi:hypothetical protein